MNLRYDMELKRLKRLQEELEKPLPEIDFAARHRADMARIEEKEAIQQAKLSIINAGYKALAKGLHPDQGGKTHLMAHLNKARDELKKRLK